MMGCGPERTGKGAARASPLTGPASGLPAAGGVARSDSQLYNLLINMVYSMLYMLHCFVT